ncbi:hypothetical protein GCM10010261_62500 [Streptomyces pilosus]|nr:hypothetical protein GCM10010261_62500 [Streptomyces pilosus]
MWPLRKAGGALVSLQPVGDAAVQHGERLLFEVGVHKQVVPALEDFHEHLVDYLFGGPAAAQVDLGKVVEELLVTQVEGLEFEWQGARGLDGLTSAAVLGRYASADVAVAHTVLQACVRRVPVRHGDRGRRFSVQDPTRLHKRPVESGLSRTTLANSRA